MDAPRLYDPDEGRWYEYHRLPAFDRLAAKPTLPRPANLDDAADRQAAQVANLFSRYAPPPIPTPPPLDRDTEWDDDLDPPGFEAQQQRSNAATMLDDLCRHRGMMPVRITDPDQTGPSLPQDASLQYLLANQEPLARVVLEQMFDWDRQTGQHPMPGMSLSPLQSPDELIGRFAVRSVEITWEHHRGTSYLVFHIDGWDMEHGSAVVVHPDRLPAWTTYSDISDLTPSDDEPEYVPTIHDKLLDAVCANDPVAVAELRAAGADLNQLLQPPLCGAVLSHDPELVDRLLATGANPNRPDPYDGRTPLRQVLREQADMGFRRAKRTPWYMWPIWLLMRAACYQEVSRLRRSLARMERALTAAGGRA